jgi:hypothetical protein
MSPNDYPQTATTEQAQQTHAETVTAAIAVQLNQQQTLATERQDQEAILAITAKRELEATGPFPGVSTLTAEQRDLATKHFAGRKVKAQRSELDANGINKVEGGWEVTAVVDTGKGTRVALALKDADGKLLRQTTNAFETAIANNPTEMLHAKLAAEGKLEHAEDLGDVAVTAEAQLIPVTEAITMAETEVMAMTASELQIKSYTDAFEALRSGGPELEAAAISYDDIDAINYNLTTLLDPSKRAIDVLRGAMYDPNSSNIETVKAELSSLEDLTNYYDIYKTQIDGKLKLAYGDAEQGSYKLAQASSLITEHGQETAANSDGSDANEAAALTSIHQVTTELTTITGAVSGAFLDTPTRLAFDKLTTPARMRDNIDMIRQTIKGHMTYNQPLEFPSELTVLVTAVEDMQQYLEAHQGRSGVAAHGFRKQIVAEVEQLQAEYAKRATDLS